MIKIIAIETKTIFILIQPFNLEFSFENNLFSKGLIRNVYHNDLYHYNDLHICFEQIE